MLVRATTLLLATMAVLAVGCGDDTDSGQAGSGSAASDADKAQADTKQREPSTNPAKAPREQSPNAGGKATGSRACATSAPPSVVINRGDISCGEAKTLVGNSRGPNNSRGPRGWNCGGFARTLKGAAVEGTSGYQCTRADDAVSILTGASAGTDPVPESGAGGGAGTDHAFTSKSGNVACEITDAVRCDIAEKTWPNPDPPASCSTDYGPYLGVGASGRGKHLCVGGAVTPGRALAYGETVARGGFKCHSSEARMRCVNEASGHGFELSRENARLF